MTTTTYRVEYNDGGKIYVDDRTFDTLEYTLQVGWAYLANPHVTDVQIAFSENGAIFQRTPIANLTQDVRKMTVSPTTPEAKPNALYPHFQIADPIKVWMLPGTPDDVTHGLLVETSKLGIFVEHVRGIGFIPWTAVQFINHEITDADES